MILFKRRYYRIHLQFRRPWFDSWARKIHCRRDRLHTPVFLGFPRGSAGKESACNAGDLGSIPGLGRSPGEGKGYPLQYSCQENPWTEKPGRQRIRHNCATQIQALLLCNARILGNSYRSPGRTPPGTFLLPVS